MYPSNNAASRIIGGTHRSSHRWHLNVCKTQNQKSLLRPASTCESSQSSRVSRISRQKASKRVLREKVNFLRASCSHPKTISFRCCDGQTCRPHSLLACPLAGHALRKGSKTLRETTLASGEKRAPKMEDVSNGRRRNAPDARWDGVGWAWFSGKEVRRALSLFVPRMALFSCGPGCQALRWFW